MKPDACAPAPALIRSLGGPAIKALTCGADDLLDWGARADETRRMRPSRKALHRRTMRWRAPKAPSRALVPAPQRLPTAPEPPAPPRRKSRWRLLLALALIFGGAGAGGFNWWRQHLAQLPDGIVSGNGRIEADEIDIDTEFAGRIARIASDEGDLVEQGARSSPAWTRATSSIAGAKANADRSRRTCASKRPRNRSRCSSRSRVELLAARDSTSGRGRLVAQGYATHELLDQRHQSLQCRRHRLSGARQGARRAGRARHEHSDPRRRGLPKSTSPTIGWLRAERRADPVSGRQHRRGAARGRQGVHDARYRATSTWTSICRRRGRPRQARDRRAHRARCLSERAIPAKVSFIASQAQFTPKTVETKERTRQADVPRRVRIDPEHLARARRRWCAADCPGWPMCGAIEDRWPAGCQAAGVMIRQPPDGERSRRVAAGHPALRRARSRSTA